MEILFLLAMLMFVEMVLAVGLADFPCAYATISILLFICLVALIASKENDGEKVSLAAFATITYTLLVFVFPPVFSHMAWGTSKLKTSAIISRDIASINASVDASDGRHILEFNSKNIQKSFEYTGDKDIPDSNSRNFGVKLVGIIDDKKYTPTINTITSWLVDNRKVIVDVFQGDTKTTIEMTALQYAEMLDAIYAIKSSSPMVHTGRTQQSDISEFQKDVERSKKVE